jgi:hypothetical protein
MECDKEQKSLFELDVANDGLGEKFGEALR